MTSIEIIGEEKEKKCPTSGCKGILYPKGGHYFCKECRNHFARPSEIFDRKYYDPSTIHRVLVSYSYNRSNPNNMGSDWKRNLVKKEK